MKTIPNFKETFKMITKTFPEFPNDFFSRAKCMVDEIYALRTREDELSYELYNCADAIRDKYETLWILVYSMSPRSVAEKIFFTRNEAVQYYKHRNLDMRELFLSGSINIDAELIWKMLAYYDKRNKIFDSTIVLLGLQKFRKCILNNRDTTGIIAKMIWSSRFA